MPDGGINTEAVNRFFSGDGLKTGDAPGPQAGGIPFAMLPTLSQVNVWALINCPG